MTRSVLVDVFKALASQLILLHHLGLYSPMADELVGAWPALMSFIVKDGRFAVQVFLVVAGFLAAQALHRRCTYPVLELAWQRYTRLAPQLVFALILVMASTALVGKELAGQAWVSPLPSPSVLLAHLFFLQDLLGVPSILAGAWYVAIDLQLFALFAALMFTLRKLSRAARERVVPALLLLAMGASVFVFSRKPELDIWAIYFVSAYGLGALAAWAGCSEKGKWFWWAAVAMVLADYLLAPRERPLWALATALALYAGHRWSWSGHGAWPARALRSLSAWSYGVFVAHFAVIILASGLWVRLGFSGVAAALAASLLVLAASLGLGAAVQAASERLARTGRRAWLALTSPR